MSYRLKIGILFFGIFFSGPLLFSQETEEPPTDDLGDVSDSFQENFFEGLKQKGIENYELAIAALQKAEKAAKSNAAQEAVVHFEMAKNLIQLKRYDEAEDRLKSVLQTTGERIDVMETLYDLYYQQKNYSAAIPLVEKLSLKDDDYKEDLANLYHRTKQYDKALALLDELDENWGESVYRDSLRKQIYQITGNTEGAISTLETKIEKNPKNEQDYLNLIYLYSQEGDAAKAFEMAKALLKNQPNSQKVHLSLYKFYLDEGEVEKAIASIKVVFSSEEITQDAKYKVLSDFLNFVSENPSYENQLESLIPLLSQSNNGAVYEQLGHYFLQKKDKTTALLFFEKGTQKDPDNFSLLKNTLLLQIDTGNNANAAILSQDALTVFPAQALLYLLNGVANNNLNKPDSAIESLEMGIDFLLDDPKMEKDFYEQLSRAYSSKGNNKKAQFYQQKALEINLSN
ncbi:MAG: tetratricopeptide repeat protein [Flavobacteriaceae bacterium]